MVNEVKMDNIGAIFPKEKEYSLDTKNRQQQVAVTGDAVSVTNNMHTFIKTVNAYQDSVSSSAVAEIKEKIAQKQYSVDLDLLADKLLSNGALKVHG